MIKMHEHTLNDVYKLNQIKVRMISMMIIDDDDDNDEYEDDYQGEERADQVQGGQCGVPR